MIYLDASNLEQEEIDYIIHAICINQISTASDLVGKFEEKIAELLKVEPERVIAVNSGTAALHISLLSAGIGFGDEVIVPASTFVGTANAVRHAGATPIFVDVDKDTWNIDCNLIADKITDKTVAIIPVHLFGNPCDMDEIINIANNFGLYIIEDAAQAFMSKSNGRYLGTIGNYGCFSFNGNKTMTTSAGGVIVCDDISKAEFARQWMTPKESELPAYNYRMTGLEAAIGLGQLLRLPEFIAKKNNIDSYYRENLSFRFQKKTDSMMVPWMTTALIPEYIDRESIPFRTREFFRPVNQYEAHYTAEYFPVAQELNKTGIMLPSSTKNGIKELEQVCQFFKGKMS